MKLIIQRVRDASVTVDQKIVGEIAKGYLVLVGVCDTDTEEIAEKMVRKMLNLRIFEDNEGKTNLNLESVNGGLLIVSQFTLYADCRKGNRPSFTKAGNPELARSLYEYVIKKCGETVPHVAQGMFGEHMEVSLVNDGPFTIILDSDEIGLHNYIM